MKTFTLVDGQDTEDSDELEVEITEELTTTTKNKTSLREIDRTLNNIDQEIAQCEKEIVSLGEKKVCLLADQAKVQETIDASVTTEK